MNTYLLFRAHSICGGVDADFVFSSERSPSPGRLRKLKI